MSRLFGVLRSSMMIINCYKESCHVDISLGFPLAQLVKDLSAMQETRFDPWVVKIPWRRKWQPTPVFWPGESHGQTSLAGYSPWGRKSWT